MKEERFFYVPNAATATELPPEEAGHAVRVLRLKESDAIFLIDGKGGIYQAEVTLASNKKCQYAITETISQLPSQFPERVHIAIAPTKMMERMEWLAEKATEIGIDEISFLESQYSERRKMRTDRIERIVISAMKQSRKAWKPVVNDIIPLKTFLDTPHEGRKFICHCHPEIERTELTQLLTWNLEPGTRNLKPGTWNLEPGTPNSRPLREGWGGSLILIGPEGDFSVEEVQYAISKGYESVSLGTSRLRTETAALVALMTARLSSKN